MLFTSPPYNEMREYNGGKDLSVTHLAKFIAVYSEHTDYQVVNLGLQRINGAINPYWDEYTKAAQDSGLKMLSWNVWSRRGMGGSIGNMIAMFRIEHEWIFVYGIDQKKLKRTVPNKTAGAKVKHTNRQKDGSLKKGSGLSVQENGVLSTVLEHDFQRGPNEHSASFPVGLVDEYIKAKKKSSVIDPFCGSGTTVIAAEKNNRVCYGMELDEKYCDVIVRRWQEFTGKKAILESSGETFN